MTGAPTCYLDHNATTPPYSQVQAFMAELAALPLNPSSVHAQGRAARGIVEEARGRVAEALSVLPQEVIFTATGTEANYLALKGFTGRKVLISAVEHSSVRNAAAGAEVIPVDAQGVLSLDALEAMLATGAPALVSVMLANNETGVIQPIADIAALCRRHGALLHTDAAQGFGKIPVDAGLLGADMLTVSAHKCGGVPGAAALVARGGIQPAPLFAGSQERGLRAGTENVAAIAGFGLAATLHERAPWGRVEALRDGMERELEAAGAVIFGKDAPRLPNTSCLAMPGVGQEVQLMSFDLAGICVSAGSACAAGRVEPSPVLLAMGAAPALAGSAVRVSLGRETSEAEVARFAAQWKTLAHRLAKAA